MNNDDLPLTRAELARRWRVDRSAVTRAFQRGEREHSADRSVPAPPAPVDPDALLLRYRPSEADPWWARIRRSQGRPRKSDTER